MEKVSQEMVFLLKNGSKTVVLEILVSLIIIETIADLPDEGGI